MRLKGSVGNENGIFFLACLKGGICFNDFFHLKSGLQIMKNWIQVVVGRGSVLGGPVCLQTQGRLSKT